MGEDSRHTLGRHGEDLAAAHMRRLGFGVLARNVRTREGEIDLIAFDGRTLAFVEVKTRRIDPREPAARAGDRPLAALGARQRARLRRLAAAWLRDSGRSRPSAEALRFDAIGVSLDARNRARRIEHIENAW